MRLRKSALGASGTDTSGTASGSDAQSWELVANFCEDIAEGNLDARLDPIGT